MSQTVTTIELTANPPAPEQEDERTAVEVPAERGPELKKGSTAVVFASVTGVTGISSLLAGVVTVCIPPMARDLNIQTSLILW